MTRAMGTHSIWAVVVVGGLAGVAAACGSDSSGARGGCTNNAGACAETGGSPGAGATGGAGLGGTSMTAAGDAAVGGSTAASGGTGEQPPAEHCEGSPTATCDAALCDTYPGCVASEKSSCSGEAAACSAFDDKAGGCAKHWGCGAGEGGACLQYTTTCASVDRSDTCNSTSGCSWQNFQCVGTPRDCTPLTHSSCDANAGCLWQTSKVAWCNGVAIGCTDMGALDCARQEGCSVAPAACSGTPTPCAPLSKSECGHQPGCQWMPGGNAPETPIKGLSQDLPDLIVTSFSAARGASGTTLSYAMSVKNRGTAKSAEIEVAFYLSKDATLGNDDDSLFASKTGPSIGPQGIDSVVGNFSIDMSELLKAHAPGLYYVGALIDPKNKVIESEEQNNGSLVPLPVYVGTDLLDLTAVGVTSSAAELQPGQELTASVTIKNSGTVQVTSAPLQLLLSQDATADASDVVVCSSTPTLNLNAGTTGSFELKCTAPRARGPQYLVARIDPQNTLGDANFTDNVAVTANAVQFNAPAPDLVVISVTSSATDLDWQQSSTIGATVKDAGTDPAPATSVTFYLSADDAIDDQDKLVCTVPLGALAAGSSAVASQSCAMPSSAVGTFQLLARVDPQDGIFETDEKNNDGSSTTPLQIAAPDINLKAGTASFSPLTTSAGSTVNFDLNLGNVGNDAAPGYRVSVYVSPDKTITVADKLFCNSERPALAAQTATSFQFSCPTPALTPGNYYVGFIIDPANAVPETVESDNSAVEPAVQLSVQ